MSPVSVISSVVGPASAVPLNEFGAAVRKLVILSQISILGILTTSFELNCNFLFLRILVSFIKNQVLPTLTSMYNAHQATILPHDK